MKRPSSMLPAGPQPFAYRGHYVKPDFTGTSWFITIDGFTLCTASSPEAARAAINDLLD